MRNLVLIACITFSCDVDEKMSGTTPGAPTAAVVTSVSTSGSEGNYTFNVEIKSPDTGCDQYADWWEVISEDTQLIYRRILAHSHVSEQPFKRSGGPVVISGGQMVTVRAHMNNLGYGTRGMQGSVETGFKPIDIPADFGQSLATQEPLPGDCPN